MAKLGSALIINGVAYDTVKGSFVEGRGSGTEWALPRYFDATVDIASDAQEDNLLWCFNGIPVAVTTPQGLSVAAMIVTPSDFPLVKRTPRKAYQVTVHLEERI